MVLNHEDAGQGISRRIASPLGRDLLQAAWTIREVVDENMAAALRLHAIEKGGDPRRATLLAFGGAGPVHAYNLARKLGVRTVIVPLRAGVFSALGLLAAAPGFQLTRTYKVSVARADFADIESLFKQLECKVEHLLRQVDRTGKLVSRRSIDMCYLGQGYTISVQLPREPHWSLQGSSLIPLFRNAYQKRYGYHYEDIPPEIVRLKVDGLIEGPEFQLLPGKRVESSDSSRSADRGYRLAYCGQARKAVRHRIYYRDLLRIGDTVQGPALVEEAESTTLIGTGGEAKVDECGSLVVNVLP